MPWIKPHHCPPYSRSSGSNPRTPPSSGFFNQRRGISFYRPFLISPPLVGLLHSVFKIVSHMPCSIPELRCLSFSLFPILFSWISLSSFSGTVKSLMGRAAHFCFFALSPESRTTFFFRAYLFPPEGVFGSVRNFFLVEHLFAVVFFVDPFPLRPVFETSPERFQCRFFLQLSLS